MSDWLADAQDGFFGSCTGEHDSDGRSVPRSSDQYILTIASVWRAVNNLDPAVMMTKAEIICRREQGLFQHLECTGQSLRLALIRRGLLAPRPVDQKSMYQDIADSFYPDSPLEITP